MKKAIIPVFSLVLLYGCADNKEKNQNTGKTKEQTTGTYETSPEDNAIKGWLLGKEWKAESEAAPFAVLMVFSRDSCGYTMGKYHYTFKNGRLEMFGAEWPLTKVNDTTFTIYVTPTQKTYTYNFVRSL